MSTYAMKNPEYMQLEEYQVRKQKLDELLKLGITPYPHKYEPTHTSGEVEDEFGDTEIGHSDDAASGSTDEIIVAGRLVLFRAMGKNAFGHLQDESGRVQVMFNRDLTELVGYSQKSEKDPKAIKIIEKKFDLGDILGVEGNLFRTQKGEITIFAKKVTLLTKALLPLPDKHGGLADKGVRYRKRWLDLIANKDSFNVFILRSKILKIIRKYFEESNFIEVETPVLQNIYGGAEASPFKTELNALHQEMFLRISLEIPLKKLLVGGMQKIYEIGKVFRNEGIDRTHNPEFTMLEAYAAYWDYNDMMQFVEKLYETIAIELFGNTKINITNSDGSDLTLNLKAPWKRITFKDAIKEYAKIDVENLDDDQIKSILKEKSSLNPKEFQSAPRGILLQNLFEEFVEKHLIQPHHIIDHPIETTPLCKPLRTSNNHKEQLVERFESFILTTEASNAYSELNDPILQRELLERQNKKRELGDSEAHPLDEDFLEAIYQGMPPASGIGIGIDRLVMLFSKVASIRDVLFFPLMKSED
jgi:lysyl-tRNA synthetase, class II